MGTVAPQTGAISADLVDSQIGKTRYCDAATGLYPFVRLVQATGATYPAATQFLTEIRAQLERRQRIEQERQMRISSAAHCGLSGRRRVKAIDDFRVDQRYGADGTRIDLAYAIVCAIARRIEDRNRSGDPNARSSHKGSEKRQADYVERTITKAISATERSRGR